MNPPSYQEACQLPSVAGDAELPPALDMTHHFSEVTKRRQMSGMKRSYKYISMPGMGNLAAGMSDAFPQPYHPILQANRRLCSRVS
jgi:hypothetical protein